MDWGSWGRPRGPKSDCAHLSQLHVGSGTRGRQLGKAAMRNQQMLQMAQPRPPLLPRQILSAHHRLRVAFRCILGPTGSTSQHLGQLFSAQRQRSGGEGSVGGQRRPRGAGPQLTASAGHRCLHAQALVPAQSQWGGEIYPTDREGGLRKKVNKAIP